MLPKIPSALRTISVITGLASLMTGGANAAILFYDGFSAGGANPAADQYLTSPSTGTGGNTGDSLIRTTNDTGSGQRPSTFGFSTNSTTGGWRTLDGVSSAVYGRVTSTGLSYAGLSTVAGAVDIFRAGSNGDAAAPQIKNYNRATTGVGAGATNLYFSALMQFDAGVRGQVGIVQGSLASIMSFGFNDAGNAVIYGNSIVTTPLGTSTTAYTAGTTYMLVAHVYSGNLVDLYLNPTSLTDQSANAGQKILSGIALNGFTLGTAISDVRLTANTGNNISNPDFIIDEIHGATTWADAFVSIPEPSAILLGAMAAAIGIGRRRRA